MLPKSLTAPTSRGPQSVLLESRDASEPHTSPRRFSQAPGWFPPVLLTGTQDYSKRRRRAPHSEDLEFPQKSWNLRSLRRKDGQKSGSSKWGPSPSFAVILGTVRASMRNVVLMKDVSHS